MLTYRGSDILIDHSQRAKELFKQGYNCSQAVVASFCNELGLDFDTAVKIASSFGAGMGRLREVCGAVSGMFMVAGLKYGYIDPKDREAKATHYKLIQELAERFKMKNHSIVCRELLGLSTTTDNQTSNYKKHPCIELVGDAAKITEEIIKEKDELV